MKIIDNSRIKACAQKELDYSKTERTYQINNR